MTKRAGLADRITAKALKELQDAFDKDENDEKQKEVENLVNPIMRNMYFSHILFESTAATSALWGCPSPSAAIASSFSGTTAAVSSGKYFW